MDKLSQIGLKYFNSTYEHFLKDISKSYPDVAEIIKKNYLDKKASKPIYYYLKHYMYEIYPHMKFISECDEKLFTEGDKPLGLLEGVNFRFIWDKADDHIRNDLWKYLHTLHLLSSFNGNIDILIDNNSNNLTESGLLDSVREVQKNYKSIKEQINKYLTKALATEFETNDDNDSDEENESYKKGINSLFGSNFNIGDTLKSLIEKINNEDSELFRLTNNIMEGIDIKELEEFTKNPIDILHMIMGKKQEGTKDPSTTFNNIISKLINNIQDGQIDINKLKCETEGLMTDVMGNLKGSDNFIGKMMSNPNFMNKITQMVNNPKMMEAMTNVMGQSNGGHENGENGMGGLENLLSGEGSKGLFSMAQEMAEKNPELIAMARNFNNPHSGTAMQEKLRRQMEAKRKRQAKEAENQTTETKNEPESKKTPHKKTKRKHRH